jgi:hypothetical protein
MDVSYLLDTNLPTDNQVETLEVHSYDNPGWHSDHSIGLALVCSQYRVKHLRFMSGGMRDYLPLLALQGKDKEYPFLNCLKSVYIQIPKANFPCESLYQHARIKLIHWDIVSGYDLTAAVAIAKTIFRKMSAHGWLDNLYSVREIKITYSRGGNEKDLPVFFGHSIEIIYFKKILARNRTAWSLCQNATLICLALGRIKKSKLPHLGRDAMSIIVKIVWSSRGTKVWAD